jgi:hypothetical protein
MHSSDVLGDVDVIQLAVGCVFGQVLRHSGSDQESIAAEKMLGPKMPYFMDISKYNSVGFTGSC